MSEQLDPRADSYYSTGRENERLTGSRGQLELERTRQLLARYLPAAPAIVLDVGGGTGVHAFWLSDGGYTVHLIDAVKLHVDQARERAESLASATVGDARDLKFDDESVDAVLLLGPLYHLTRRSERLTALREAIRTLKPGGVVVAVSISRFASLFDGIVFGMLADPTFGEIVERDLDDGQHRNVTDNPGYFTTAYFHRPEELAEEVTEAGFHVRDVVGVEGPAYWLSRDLDNALPLDARLLATAQRVEREPSILALSAHLMVVGDKPKPAPAGQLS